MQRYSDMTKDELYAEMQRLIGEARKKEQAGFISEANILEQKYYMAKSYLLPPEEIHKGQSYGVAGEKGVFTVRYLNGVFAWGTLEGDEEEVGFPIGRLEPLNCQS
ncbi:YfhH family protein [Caldalkalibacillus salinus]|uniref:YfhH family protein n=1 Tax=Caldalkalibacillus salinus TaxID=2803787 RepID=UPI001923D141|nr:YfhH family protein [Caldalkalibacillus salinus]